MENGVGNVSFGAHISLKNNSLCKHVSKGVANKFAEGTKSIPGIMTIEKTPCETITVTLNKCKDQCLTLDANDLYRGGDKEKLSFLKRVVKYIDQMIKFEKIENPTKKEVSSYISRLDKIVAKDDTSLALVHDINRDFLLNKTV